MNPAENQRGFTIIELLVVISLFAILSIGFYSVVLSGVRGSNTTESVVRISEEARFGLNRMIRDTREAARLRAASPTSYTIEVDFNGQNGIEPALGEVETFTFDAASGQIRLSDGTSTAVLVQGISRIPPGVPVFDFSSNQLEYDRTDASLGFVDDGVATWQEVDRPPSGTPGGNADGQLGLPELPYLTNVSYAFRVRSGDRVTSFYAEAELRNRRVAPTPSPT